MIGGDFPLPREVISRSRRRQHFCELAEGQPRLGVNIIDRSWARPSSFRPYGSLASKGMDFVGSGTTRPKVLQLLSNIFGELVILVTHFGSSLLEEKRSTRVHIESGSDRSKLVRQRRPTWIYRLTSELVRFRN